MKKKLFKHPTDDADVLVAQKPTGAREKKNKFSGGEAIAAPEQKQIPNVTFMNVLLHEIIPDPNQPRHYYNQADDDELMHSVREKGVLQPILLRNRAEGNFMIVCGERRYRAAVAVSKVDTSRRSIPATIRHLDDDEALEIQIIENLQRKDVQPMEEAVAFRSLHNRMSVEELALRVGKSAQYVALRMQLTNLVNDFQEMLSQHKMKLTQAYKLCRLSADSQQTILKELMRYGAKDWRKNPEYELNNIDNFVRTELLDLSKAPFKTKDPLLYPEMGACDGCKFNTANAPLLFPELNKKRFCNYAVCYQVKTNKSYQKKLEQVLAEPEVLIINTSSYLNDQEKQKIKAIEEMGATVLKDDIFKILKKPEPVDDWETYLKDNDDFFDEEATDEEKQANLQEVKDDYELELKHFKTETAEYDQAIASGNVKKAFVAVGNNWEAKEGQFVDVIIKPKPGARLPEGMSASGINKTIEIESMKARETRNEEIDREKVFKQAMAELSPMYNGYADVLHPEEIKALVVALGDNSYRAREFFKAELLGSDGPDSIKTYYKLPLLNIDSPFVTRLIRIFLYDKLLNPAFADYTKSGKSAALYAVAKLWLPEKVAELEAAQQAKTDKRKENVEKRLKALSDE